MKFYNPATINAEQWVTVVVEGPGVGDHGVFRQALTGDSEKDAERSQFVAVGGPMQGRGRIYHVRARLNRLSVAEGALAAEPGEPAPYRFSEWVGDDLLALVPRLHLISNGQEHVTPMPIFHDGLDATLPPNFVRIADTNAARLLAQVRAVIPGLGVTMDNYAHIFTDQDVVELETTLTFGTTDVPGVSLQVDEMWIETGEYFHVEYRERKGFEPPLRVEDKWRQRIVTSPRGWGRGQQIDVSGALLCLPPWDQIPATLAQSTPEVKARLDNLTARKEVPILGGQGPWSDWLAFGRPAEVPAGDPDEGRSESSRRVRQFAESLSVAGDIADVRPYGLAQSAAQTGNQEDFGASSGFMAAVAGDPAAPYVYRYSVEGWAMRPDDTRESNGEPVKADRHPECRQWSHIPDPRQGTADLLGWPIDRPWGWYGPQFGSWSAMDDQHYSINLLVAYLQLTGSPAASAIVDRLMEMDKMRVPNRIGAPRAVGRRLLAWAHIMAAGNVAQRATAAALIRDLMGDVVLHADMFTGGHINDPQATVRVISSTGAKYGWTEANDPTKLIRSIVVWEESFCAMGLRATALQLDDPTYDEYAYFIAKTIVKHGVYKEAGVWHCCYAIRAVVDPNGQHTGRGLVPAAYTITQPNYNVFTYDSMWSWIMPAVLIYRELAKRHFPSDPEIARADEIVSSVIGTRPGSWSQAEWLACAPINSTA